MPLLGLAWWALDFPFMKRYSREELARRPELAGRDIEATQRACAKFRDIPVSIMNFAEGTRYTGAKHAAQASPFPNLLNPKAGGVAFVGHALVVDVGAADGAIDGIGDLLLDHVGHLAGHRVGHLFGHAFLHVRDARNLLGHAALTPHLAGAGLRRLLAGHPAPAARGDRLAGARVEAAIAAFLPHRVAAAGLGVALVHALARQRSSFPDVSGVRQDVGDIAAHPVSPPLVERFGLV